MRFIDGTQGEVDMTEILTGESPGVFVALRDPGFFTDAMRASFEAVMERGLREQTRFFFLAWSVLLAAIIGLYARSYRGRPCTIAVTLLPGRAVRGSCNRRQW